MNSKSLIIFISAVLALMIVGIACSKDDYNSNVNTTTLDLSGNNYDYMGVSSRMGLLGRVLFYDKTLSVNNAVSCGSCHKQAFAFSDNRNLSKGFENLFTDRNTPPIQNLSILMLRSNPIILPPNGGDGGQALFWDGRERFLKTMVMQPIFNHVEMGMSNPQKIVERVKSKPYYKDLFIDAFGDDEITIDRIAEALSGFTGSIVSDGSRFDASHNFFNDLNTSNNLLTIREREGLRLFFEKYDCGSCHNLFSERGYDFMIPDGEELVNIGLDMEYEDNGRGLITGRGEDNGKFKIPNLRNVALTGPYMHDGRFSTLEEVIDHYNTGIKAHPNLDERLKDSNGNAMVMNITEEEKGAIIAFLHSLTDNSMITDPKFSDPFKKR